MYYSQFWSENPGRFITYENWLHFFPSPKMTSIQKWNSLVRLALYISIVLFLYSGKWYYWSIFIIAALLSYALYHYSSIELFSNHSPKPLLPTQVLSTPQDTEPVFVQPTQDNPFMNIQMMDYKLNPQRESESKKSVANMSRLNKEVDDKFNINLYKDLSDIFDKMNSQRQYYTTPVTTIPNKQKTFANWCYQRPPTCKENNGVQCEINNHNPFKPIHSTKIYV